jgi:CHAT domain-containing protein
MSLTGMGGWAKRFIEAGAACFIGSLWSVYDDAAHKFSVSFYEQVLAGATIGRAVREARQAARQLNNPSWLAYTVFADPLATVKAADEFTLHPPL